MKKVIVTKLSRAIRHVVSRGAQGPRGGLWAGWADIPDKPNFDALYDPLGAADAAQSAAAADATSKVNAHEGAADPHAQYALDTDLSGHTGNTSNPHSTTAAQVGADPAGAAASAQVAAIAAAAVDATAKANAAQTAAVDTLRAGVAADGDTLAKLRALIQGIQTLLTSDNINLDTLQEIVDFVELHQSSLDSLGTGKVNVSDIINVLTDASTAKPLSAAQGKVLKDLIDALVVVVSGKEPTITAGTSAQFWRGDKTWADFATGVDAWWNTASSAFGRTLANVADEAAGRTALGLGTIATQNAASVEVGTLSASGQIYTVAGIDSDGSIKAAASSIGVQLMSFEAARAFHLATLPASTLGTYDHLRIVGTSGAWGSGSKSRFELIIGNRDGLTVRYLEGQLDANRNISLHPLENGNVEVYATLSVFSTMELQMYGCGCTINQPVVEQSASTAATWSAADAYPRRQSRYDTERELITVNVDGPGGQELWNRSNGGSAYAGTRLRNDINGEGGVFRLSSINTGYAGPNSTMLWSGSGTSSIWNQGADPIVFATNNVARISVHVDGHLLPHSDGWYNLGSGGQRFGTVFAATGTINTSDAREKTDVRQLNDAEIQAAKQISKAIGAYRWLDAVAKKGDMAREHIGLTVQRAIEIFESNGLNPFAYGFICFDEWDERVIEHPAVEAVEGKAAWVEEIEHPEVLDDDGNVVTPAGIQRIEHPAVEAVEAKDAWIEVVQTAGNRYSFRMDELNLFIARGLDARLSALEAAQ